LLRFSGDGHIMVFAPTGAGKGIGFVQPNLADYQGSMVILDPKGENAIVSAALRGSMGHDVWILDPFGKTGMVGKKYNPLGALSYADKANLGPMIEALADALIPISGHEREPHWPMGAKKFVSFLLWFMVAHVEHKDRHLVKLFELAHSGYGNLEVIAAGMAAGHHPDAEIRRICVALGNWFMGREAKEFSYFESQVVNNLGWIGDFVWNDVLASEPSRPLPLKGKAMTVYLVLPFNRIERYRPWLRVMIADLINCLYDSPGTPEQPVLFMLDEAYAGLGQMESLFAAQAAVRSAGARLCFIYQDIQQVEKLYGTGWASLVSNSGVTLFWEVNDLKAAQYISQYAGSRTVIVPGQPLGVGQALVRVEEALQRPADEITALFRSLPPARFGRLNVLTDGRFKSRLAKNSIYEAALPSGEIEELEPRSFVPLFAEGDAKDAGEGRKLEALTREFGRPVTKNAKGEYGYEDEKGFWVPLIE
jgi:type IV secretion system protein VirD4